MTDPVEPLISAEVVGQRLALTEAQVAAEFEDLGFLVAGQLRFRWSEIAARLEARRSGARLLEPSPPAVAKTRQPRSTHSGRPVDRQLVTARRERFPITTRRTRRRS